MISRQCEAGRHAGGYAKQVNADGRIIGDAFQPACCGRVKPQRTNQYGVTEPCACPCHAPGVKLT